MVLTFNEVCRQLGIRATHQRAEIFRELVKSQEHPDAKTIYLRVRKRIPTISFDTVYRNLRLMEEQGAISKIGAGVETMRFDAVTAPHHHFVCRRCGKIRDIYRDEWNDLQRPPGIDELGDIESIHVEVRGLCADCLKAKAKPQ